MLLSEAIRLGAMLRPQVRGVTSNDEGTCAIGSALDAVGLGGHLYCSREATDAFPVLFAKVSMPNLWHEDLLVLSAIRMLNDLQHWTREQIADWVEGIERERGLIAQTTAMLDVLGALAAPIQEEK